MNDEIKPIHSVSLMFLVPLPVFLSLFNNLEHF